MDNIVNYIFSLTQTYTTETLFCLSILLIPAVQNIAKYIIEMIIFLLVFITIGPLVFIPTVIYTKIYMKYRLKGMSKSERITYLNSIMNSSSNYIERLR